MSEHGATRIVGPDGDQRVDYYSGDGCRTKVTVGYGTTEAVSTTISYDPATFMPTTVTDGRGNDWVYSYNDPANPRSATAINDPLGRTSQFTFNPSGQLLTATDASGVVTALEYDANGNLEKSTAAVGTPSQTVTDIVFDPGHPGDAIAVIDGRGKQWTATYDPVTGGRLSSTDPEGNTTAFEHNAIGWLTGTVAPAGNVAGATAEDHRTHFQHNAYGDVTTTINPADEATVSVYDAHRNLISVTDADGDVTQLAYSDADQLATTTSGQGTPEAATTTYNYFPDGALQSWAKDGSGTWSYAYDTVGRLTAETDPNGNSTAYRYDGNGNLTSLVQPGGDCGTGIGCITYGYDLANQLTSIDYSDPDTADVIGYGYDQAGRRTTAQLSGGATSTWVWTPLGQLASHTDSGGRTVDYSWDAAGNLESIWYPGQTTPVTYSYDQAGRMNSVADWLGNTTSFAYDSNSNLTSTVFPAGTGNVDSYTYDRANRLGTITWNDGSTALGSVNYTRAPDGQVTAAATTGVPLGPQSFGYDARDQLTDLDATTTYRYDTAGNPTTVADDTLQVLDPVGNTTTLADGRLQVFDPAQQLCWSSPTATSGSCDTPQADATTYAYDTRGNRTDAISPAGTSTSYTYDQANRLTRAQLSDLSSTDTTQFTYHPDGLRATKTGTRTGTSEYTWDTAGGLPLLLTETTSQGDTHLVYGPGGMPVAQIGADSGVGWLHHDHLGSTRLVTDQTGGAIGAYTYDPYGQHSDSTGTYDVLLDYAGQYTDHETGLQYLRARYYDPTTSQFLTRDPLVGITHEPYTYANNNPTNLSDPTGLCPICAVAVIVAVADAAATAWDAYDTYKTVTNGCVSGATKAAAGGLFIAGLFLPGNLGWADNVARHAPRAITRGSVDDVLQETVTRRGNFTSAHRLSAAEALTAGERWVGGGYTEIGKPGSGVFQSADGTRRFQIDNGSLSGSRNPGVPHVHLETVQAGRKQPVTNNHIPFWE